jgi:hypothetical protein
VPHARAADDFAQLALARRLPCDVAKEEHMKTFRVIALVLGLIGCGAPTPTDTTTEAIGRPVGDPCRVQCHVQWDQCNEACDGDYDPKYCMCLCQNMLALCIGQCNGGGTPPLRECVPSVNPGDGR